MPDSSDRVVRFGGGPGVWHGLAGRALYGGGIGVGVAGLFLSRADRFPA